MYAQVKASSEVLCFQLVNKDVGHTWSLMTRSDAAAALGMASSVHCDILFVQTLNARKVMHHARSFADRRGCGGVQSGSERGMGQSPWKTAEMLATLAISSLLKTSGSPGMGRRVRRESCNFAQEALRVEEQLLLTSLGRSGTCQESWTRRYHVVCLRPVVGVSDGRTLGPGAGGRKCI